MLFEEILSQFFSYACDDSSRYVLIENIFQQDQEKPFTEMGNGIRRAQNRFQVFRGIMQKFVETAFIKQLAQR